MITTAAITTGGNGGMIVMIGEEAAACTAIPGQGTTIGTGTLTDTGIRRFSITAHTITRTTIHTITRMGITAGLESSTGGGANKQEGITRTKEWE